MASVVVDWRKAAPYPGRSLPDQDRRIVGVARLTGDALAVMVITVTPLGAVRSFMAPALIRGGVPIAALAVGMIGAVALPLAWGRLELGKLMTSMSRAAEQASPPDNVPAPAAAHTATGADSPPAAEEGSRSGVISALARWWSARPERRDQARHLAGSARWLKVVGAVFLLTDVWLIVAPLNATHIFGVLATVVIAIGSLATLLGTLAFLVQTRKPLSVFRFLRLNVTPVLTIIVIIAVAGGVFDSRSSLHQVIGPVAAGTAPRPSLSSALAAWLRSPLTTSCAVRHPERQRRAAIKYGSFRWFRSPPPAAESGPPGGP